MSRRVIGYTAEGRTIWQDLGWDQAVRHVGARDIRGGPIEELPSATDVQREAARRHREGMRRLREGRAA